MATATDNYKGKLICKRLTPNTGAIVEGIKLDSPLDTATIEAINEALVTHHVLFFRNQDLDPLSQKELAAKFGTLQVHPLYPSPPGIPEIVVLDTGGHNPPDADIW